jgi:hypothetical protein
MFRPLSVLCVLFLSGCATQDREPELFPASGVATPSARSIDRITLARCEREARCNNIGHERRFESREDCHDRLSDRAYEFLGPAECPKGIDPAQLNECLQAIQDEGCGNVIDSIERVAVCRIDSLCAD